MRSKNSDNTWLTTRREFLKSTTFALAGSAFAPFLLFNQCENTKSVRFGILTDTHYADAEPRGTRFYRDSIAKLDECIKLFKDQKVDFIIELGDFKDQDEPPKTEKTLAYLRTIENTFQKFQGPAYHVLGNHDMDSISKKQFLTTIKNTGISADNSYYSFDSHQVHFIVLDANYTSGGEDYDCGNYDWKDANIPNHELEWLQKDLAATPYPVVVFNHQLLDGTGHHYVKNSKKVRTFLENSQKVMAVFQGHFHDGQYNLLNNIHYYTLKAVIEGAGLENNSCAIVEILPDLSVVVTGYWKAKSHNMKKTGTLGINNSGAKA